jgi:hypothetical protein
LCENCYLKNYKSGDFKHRMHNFNISYADKYEKEVLNLLNMGIKDERKITKYLIKYKGDISTVVNALL